MLHIYFDLCSSTLIWTAVGRSHTTNVRRYGQAGLKRRRKKKDFCSFFLLAKFKKNNQKVPFDFRSLSTNKQGVSFGYAQKNFGSKCLEVKLLWEEIIVLLFWKHVTHWAFLILFNSLTDYFCTAHFKWTLVELPQFVLRCERKGKTLSINDLHRLFLRDQNPPLWERSYHI